jgi:hypothetical protein
MSGKVASNIAYKTAQQLSGETAGQVAAKPPCWWLCKTAQLVVFQSRPSSGCAKLPVCWL